MRSIARRREGAFAASTIGALGRSATIPALAPRLPWLAVDATVGAGEGPMRFSGDEWGRPPPIHPLNNRVRAAKPRSPRLLPRGRGLPRGLHGDLVCRVPAGFPADGVPVPGAHGPRGDRAAALPQHRPRDAAEAVADREVGWARGARMPLFRYRGPRLPSRATARPTARPTAAAPWSRSRRSPTRPRTCGGCGHLRGLVAHARPLPAAWGADQRRLGVHAPRTRTSSRSARRGRPPARPRA